MSYPWFRLYSEILDDEKVQLMSFEEQRHLVMLFALRCQRPTEKMTPKQIAFRLRVTETFLETLHETFLKHGFIDSDWSICNWNKRQFVSDSSTERVRKYREKSALKQSETFLKRHVTENVTAPEQIQNRTEQKHKRKKDDFVLPDWISVMAWNGFVEMRQKLKKPLTEHAKTLAVARLVDFRDRGYDPTAILENSTMHCYQGLFEPRENGNGTQINQSGQGQRRAQGNGNDESGEAGHELFDALYGPVG